jgi:hypothetical protein
MSKAARSARVASRQRVETISADKVIGSAETGELYVVTAKALITLPAVQDGAYFKFVVGADIANDANVLKITAGSAIMKGGIVEHKDATAGAVVNSNAAITYINVDANGSTNNKLLAGSVVECVCDGTNWYVSGTILTAATVAVTLA